jgi:beta-lactamase class A
MFEAQNYRGSRPFYPCSVVKLFYLAAARARLEEGLIHPHAELDRAMRDMILLSSNTATNYVIDLITGTTGDTLLEAEERGVWEEKRQWVNRYFRSFGWPEFKDINVCQKLMDDQRYGRERLFAGSDGRNHNSLTTDAVARLFYAVFTGNIVNAGHSEFLVNTLARSLDPKWLAEEPAAQVIGYFGDGLPQGSRLWSKAGSTRWTGDPTASYRRHDAAYVELSNGLSFTLVAFTEGKAISEDETCLPMIARTASELVISPS